MDKLKIETTFKKIQDSICLALENSEKTNFQEDLWTREEGGGGRTRVLQDGANIEKGGVNFSAVQGATPDKILQALKLEKSDFYATGVSIVMHPNTPHIPIIHMNIRYFEMDNGTWWFGGGIDLTPHYVDKDQARFFHNSLKSVCDKYSVEYYDKFKTWADDYFFIKHRKETRGVGGIFFDRLNEQSTSLTKEQLFNFVTDVGNTFAKVYIELINLNKDKSYTEQQKQWQYIRRSRYAEFNLVYDKGTKFGLDTDGRIESILMSMPPLASWKYDYKPTTEEQETLDLLKKNIDWIND